MRGTHAAFLDAQFFRQVMSLNDAENIKHLETAGFLFFFYLSVGKEESESANGANDGKQECTLSTT